MGLPRGPTRRTNVVPRIAVRFWFTAFAALMGSAAVVAQTATLAPGATTLGSSGGVVTLSFNVTYPAPPATFALDVVVPAGWTYQSGTGEPSLKPDVGAQGTLSWLNINPQAGPVQFSFVVGYPSSVAAATVTSAVVLHQNSTQPVDPKNPTGPTHVVDVTTHLTPTAIAFTVASTGGGGVGSGGGGGSSGGGSSGGGGGGGASSVVPVIATQPASQAVAIGSTVTLAVSATSTAPLSYLWRKNGQPVDGATTSTLTLSNVQPSDAGGYFVVVSNSQASATSVTAVLTVGLPPTILTQPASQTAAAGTPVLLSATASAPAGGAAPTYQWRRDGSDVSGATAGMLALDNVQPLDAGIYTAAVTSVVTTTSAPAVVGVSTLSKVIGAGDEIGVNIVHPNGNVFDQVLLTGPAEAITADSVLNQITRTSFIDPNDDIVQVELSGPGTLSLVLDASSGPAAPANYNQPAVAYMKGRARIVVTGANANTNLTVFTVGRATAFDPTGAFNILLPISSTNNPANNGSSLFAGHTATVYNGIADIAYIAILSTDGKFGGLRSANARYSAGAGLTGIYAPGVQFLGPLYLGDISATGAASPVIVVGSAGDARITGGSLLQANGQPVQVTGVTQLKFTSGQDSGGNVLPAQANRAVLQQNGVDVTTTLVVNPGP